jgi:hypothetical protein
MKERPILFSAPMVRALLGGSKTQTRRVVKLTDAGHVKEPNSHRRWHPDDPSAIAACPYGQPGDRLWVRETFTDLLGSGIEHRPIPSGPLQRYVFAADIEPGSYGDEARKEFGVKWKPSMFMPRWASRITLEITAVRVERLQDIGEADAIAEGVYDGKACKCAEPLDFVRSCGSCGGRMIDAIGLYQSLWESINGRDSWAVNPWVWVIEFKKVTP